MGSERLTEEQVRELLAFFEHRREPNSGTVKRLCHALLEAWERERMLRANWDVRLSRNESIEQIQARADAAEATVQQRDERIAELEATLEHAVRALCHIGTPGRCPTPQQCAFDALMPDPETP